jgi:hypothetical protein
LNYRVADDIVYNYTLEQGKSYEYAQGLIERYESETATVVFKEGDETKGTSTIIQTFNDLSGMKEYDFMELLCENKKNFLGYNKTSQDEFVRMYDELVALIVDDIEKSNATAEIGELKGYSTKTKKAIELHSEIIYDGFLRSLIAKKSGDDKKAAKYALSDILRKFPTEDNISAMRSGAWKNRKKATDLGQGFARKTFMLCFFAKYILRVENIVGRC